MLLRLGRAAGVHELTAQLDQAFIVRFWREAGYDHPEDPRRWRAKITAVSTGQEFHAGQLEEAFAIIRRILTGAEAEGA